ncbi:MAG: HAMP domain-containing histidine kinase [Oscillospiraceae bacterium]|nr:HAMP domain-containing histidine kinase [Oscillospiraceae bacterium]
MNELAQSIQNLYEPDDEPVIGVSGGCIQFFNSAALRLFPNIAVGVKASSALPASFLDSKNALFVSTARIRQHSVSATGVWYSGLLLLRVHIEENRYQFSADAFLNKYRYELATMRLALDHLNKNGSMDSSVYSVMQHSYFKLLRLCDNLSLASNLSEKKLVYRPELMGLKAWLTSLIDAINKAAASLRIHVELHCDMEKDDFYGDPKLLEQMLLNIISNSIAHSKPESKITLRVSSVNNSVRLVLDDKGSGFTSEQFGSMFRRRCDETLDGKGIGLFLVWGIAEMHGGSVSISNHSRVGSRVVILLPEQRRPVTLHSPTLHYGRDESLQIYSRVVTCLADYLPQEIFNERI